MKYKCNKCGNEASDFDLDDNVPDVIYNCYECEAIDSMEPVIEDETADAKSPVPVDTRPRCLGCGKPINHGKAVTIKGVHHFHTDCVPEGDPDYNRDEVMSHNVGDSDYAKKKIQPWDIWEEYELNPWDADIIKRVLRTKSTQSRRLDYEKIIHLCQKRISQIDKEPQDDVKICERCCAVRYAKFKYCPECGTKEILK